MAIQAGPKLNPHQRSAVLADHDQWPSLVHDKSEVENKAEAKEKDKDGGSNATPSSWQTQRRERPSMTKSRTPEPL